MPLDERAKVLLSDDALPTVSIPRARTHHQRNFRLPSCVNAPRERSATELPAEARPQRASTAFGDMTTTWLRQGDELEVHLGELQYEDPPRRLRARLIIGAMAITVVLVAVINAV